MTRNKNIEERIISTDDSSIKYKLLIMGCISNCKHY